MKIIPMTEGEIKVETDKGTFDIHSLVGGGLEIHSQEGETMTVACRGTGGTGKSPARFRKVVIREV